MIDKEYCIDYDYEIEIIIYYSKNENEKIGYQIWEGYFVNLLDGCYEETIKEDGILYGYMLQEEWYDEKPWKIKNIHTAIQELEQYSKNRTECDESMLDKIDNIKNKLINLFKKAIEYGQSVYIEYD